MTLKNLQRTLAAVICIFMLAAAYISVVMYQRQSALQSISRYNASWTVSQALVEFLHLENSIAAYAVLRGGQEFADVQLRLDIMFSRLDTFEAGTAADFENRSLRRFVTRDPQNETIISSLRAKLEAVDELLGRQGAAMDVGMALKILAPLNAELTALASRAAAYGAELTANDREELDRLHFLFSALAYGLILCGVVLIVLLSRQNKLLGAAHDSLQATTGELTQTHRRLADQNQRFDAALNNMSQALCNCDAEGRLVVFNEQFARLMGVPSKELQDVRLQDMIAQLHASHVPTAMEPLYQRQAEHIRDRTKGKFELDLADGRSFAVAHEPLSGGGWLATYADVTERRRTHAEILHMAHHDALTGLSNRLLFRTKLADRFTSSVSVQSCDLLLLDLDGFKEVNDTVGHDVGDQLLKEVAARLCSCVLDPGSVSRLGGDEFAVLMAQGSTLEEALDTAEKILSCLSQPYHFGGNEIEVSASIGIAARSGPDGSPEELLKHADLAMYQAKAAGKGRIMCFSSEMEEQLSARKSLEADLREALPRGELEVYYQSLHDTQSLQVVGFEALLRWKRGGHTEISPADFIPVAEMTGMIDGIGDWVMRQACHEALNWPSHVTVAVNLSPVQFRSGKLVTNVIRALSDSGLPPHRLELEITESVLLEASAATLSTLNQLKQLGLRIALDDFGTGYSSLSYLSTFSFDKIKIDRSFVQTMSTREDAAAVVEMVVQLSNRLGIGTTAEGVETEAQLVRLQQIGCTQVQGYLLATPQPAKQLILGALGRTAAISG